eukprot:6187059-Pleurochrysis_carterae.AAC.2
MERSMLPTQLSKRAPKKAPSTNSWRSCGVVAALPACAGAHRSWTGSLRARASPGRARSACSVKRRQHASMCGACLVEEVEQVGEVLHRLEVVRDAVVEAELLACAETGAGGG